jgi:phosphoglycolate phosphatase
MSAVKIQNLIFDVDGTLLDSKRDIAGAQLWALQQLGVHHYTEEDIYPHIGKPLRETFRVLLPTELHSRIPDAAVMYRNYYLPRAFDTTTLFPGVKETLEILHIKGFRLAAATTKSTETTGRVLAHFGIAHFFIQLQGTDNVPPKPDPFILNKLVTDQGWKKESIMMIGDSSSDVLAARNAGIAICGVTYGSSAKETMEALHPDAIIDTFPQLLSILS